ncbi:acyl-CoA dehydrogenase family protein [Streptomyces sp. NPDC086554]|uniref:acyl-CoA dehydrogenase family protein n=1 Tax=Streptomyces sp. NPDC086554 TaxID=3154864 RepID=UPI003432F9AE
MEADNTTCDILMPGLRRSLAEIPLAELEADRSSAIDLFRGHYGPNLLVPASYGGTGAKALDAVRTVRALGAVAPSLTVATMMHHFSVGSLFAVAEVAGTPALESALRRIADERMLVASGFAEGRVGQGILTPTMQARPVDGGYLISGTKKPCSMAESMDLLTASVALPTPDGSTAMGVALLPADVRGLTVHPFWSTFALAGAQSHEVRLNEVFATEDEILAPTPELADRLFEVHGVGLIWFQMIVCAAYTGIASTLVQRVLERSRGTASDRAALAVRIESAAALTEGLALRVDSGDTGNDTLARALVTRYAVQDTVVRSVGQAVELLGGMAYVSSSDVAYLAAASQAIAFHPPSRTSAAEGLLGYFAGQPLLVA